MLGQRNTPAQILAEFGMCHDVFGVHFIDMNKAENAYIHHSRMPVALAAFAAASPAFARGRFPKVRLIDLVAKRPHMDEDEAVAFAEIGGAEARPPFWGRKEPFYAHLSQVCDTYGLWSFFYLEDGRAQLSAFRPLGYSSSDGLDDAAMKFFRAAVKKQDADQMTRNILASTIFTLYRGDAHDKTWLGRWCNWHAADALPIIRGDAELCADWHKLVALYPGW